MIWAHCGRCPDVQRCAEADCCEGSRLCKREEGCESPGICLRENVCRRGPHRPFGNTVEEYVEKNTARTEATKAEMGAVKEQAKVATVEDTLAERGKKYGEYADVAASAQRLKVAARQAPGWDKMSATHQESVDMILHKVARIISGGDPNYVDNWHDIGGYAKLSEDRCKPEMKYTITTARPSPKKYTPTMTVELEAK